MYLNHDDLAELRIWEMPMQLLAICDGRQDWDIRYLVLSLVDLKSIP